MTSFIAAGGSGRSTSVIPAVPAASSVTTIAFIRHLPVSSFSPVTLLHRRLRSALGEATALRWIRQLNALERCPCRQKSSTEQKDGDPPAPRQKEGSAQRSEGRHSDRRLGRRWDDEWDRGPERGRSPGGRH